MYSCARRSEWGDRLPLHYEQQENPEETETTTFSETTTKDENT